MAINFHLQEIPNPELEFGGPIETADPKIGLANAGPFDLRFGSARKNKINIGFVGDLESISKGMAWVQRIKSTIPSSMSNKIQYPTFNGFKNIFHSEININEKWNIELPDHLYKDALSQSKVKCFSDLLELYSSGFDNLSRLDSFKPDVILCCISTVVIDKCWSIQNKKINNKISKLVMRIPSQLAFEFDDIEEETQEDILNRDFRRALKARAMKFGIPIQIGTDKLFIDQERNQDPSIRAWNFAIALYYKAGGIPWRLRKKEIESCFVGISFHHLFTTNNNHLVRSCIAQAFSSDGEGFAIRGLNLEYDAKQGMDVHLTNEQAFQLGEKIQQEYLYRTGSTPLRIVIHKSSKFTAEEIQGFQQSLHNIPIVELVHLSKTAVRLVRFGEYPPNRGTLVTINNESNYLFTTGFMNEIKTYPGPHVPSPIKIVTTGDDIYQCAKDILALSRMNWNTASITGGQPVTLFFSRKVGGIMAEFGDKEPPSSFRFYI